MAKGRDKQKKEKKSESKKNKTKKGLRPHEMQ